MTPVHQAPNWIFFRFTVAPVQKFHQLIYETKDRGRQVPDDLAHTWRFGNNLAWSHHGGDGD